MLQVDLPPLRVSVASKRGPRPEIPQELTAIRRVQNTKICSMQGHKLNWFIPLEYRSRGFGSQQNSDPKSRNGYGLQALIPKHQRIWWIQEYSQKAELEPCKDSGVFHPRSDLADPQGVRNVRIVIGTGMLITLGLQIAQSRSYLSTLGPKVSIICIFGASG